MKSKNEEKTNTNFTGNACFKTDIRRSAHAADRCTKKEDYEKIYVHPTSTIILLHKNNIKSS